MKRLSDISDYVTEKISSDCISLNDYVTTDNILQNKAGRIIAENLPPKKCSLTHYKKGDVLIANIRPYLKKIWYADSDGGASTDVLVFRAKSGINSAFLYSVLLQDAFYDYVMKAPKGSKMPRGDQDHIMRFTVLDVHENEQKRIAKVLTDIDSKIALNKKINKELETMAKEIYDYWFVQFDFPNAQGKPYKSSGGKMVYNPLLKREIPEGWEVKEVEDIISPIERGLSYTSKEIENLNGIPMMNLACFDKAGNYRTGELKYFSGKYSDEDLLKPLDILIACTDLTQKADIIGTPIFVPCENSEFVYSTDLAKLVPLNNDDKFYLYYYLKNDIFHSYIKPFASGTTVKHLDVKGVLRYPYIQPNEKIVKNFSSFIEPVRKEISRLQDDNVKLTTLRNELLPLLMNGQVSVKE